MTKKTILSLILCLFVAVTVNAAKSAGKIRMVKQPDGTMLSYQVLGDENLNWEQTTDGVLVIWDNNAYCVGKVTGYGTVTSTGIVAHNKGARSDEELKAIAVQDENRATFFTATSASRAKSGLSGNIVTYTSGTICPHSGTITVPVALVQYSDSTFKVNATFKGFDAAGKYIEPTDKPSAEDVRTIFTEYFNDIDASFVLGANSVGKYFKDASNGELTLKFELHGPYTLPHPHNYYGHVGSNKNALYSDALDLLDADVNFADSKYDSNGDGNVDMVTVLFAGGGANLTCVCTNKKKEEEPNDFWPACWYGTYEGEKDGKKIPVIGAFSELDDYPTKVGKRYTRAGVGVTCHELSHGMGLPDLYDTNTSAVRDNYNNNGPEWWDLMDGGENIGDGFWPCQYLAWEKDYFKWNEAEKLSEARDLTLMPLNEGGKAYKIINPNQGTAPEYYVVEVAQSTEWNSGLFKYYLDGVVGSEVPAGLLIEHVTTSALQSMAPNNTYNEGTGYKPGLTLVPADGEILAQSSYSAGSITADDFLLSLAGDMYPGTQNVTSLAAYKNYNGAEMVYKYPIYNIKKNEDGSVSFRFGFGLDYSDFNKDGAKLVFDKTVQFADDKTSVTCNVSQGTDVVTTATLSMSSGDSIMVAFAKTLDEGSYTLDIPANTIMTNDLSYAANSLPFAVGNIEVKANVTEKSVTTPEGISKEVATTTVTTAVKENKAVSQVDTGVKEAVKDKKSIDFGQGVVITDETPVAISLTITYDNATVAKDNSDNTIVTAMTFDVTPTAIATVSGVDYSATVSNNNLEGTMRFRLPIDKNATYMYAYITHSGQAFGQVPVQTASNEDKYIELEVTSFSKYGYTLTDTPTALQEILSTQPEQKNDATVRKYIHNGQVVIYKNGKVYNLAGAIIK